jgi:hypothetical protein
MVCSKEISMFYQVKEEMRMIFYKFWYSPSFYSTIHLSFKNPTVYNESSNQDWIIIDKEF